MYFLNNTQFSGASGPVQFAGADRTGIISINQLVGNKTRFVGQFSADIHRNASERMTLLNGRIQWMTKDGFPPSDGTPGMIHSAVSCSPVLSLYIVEGQLSVIRHLTFAIC